MDSARVSLNCALQKQPTSGGADVVREGVRVGGEGRDQIVKREQTRNLSSPSEPEMKMDGFTFGKSKTEENHLVVYGGQKGYLRGDSYFSRDGRSIIGCAEGSCFLFVGGS